MTSGPHIGPATSAHRASTAVPVAHHAPLAATGSDTGIYVVLAFSLLAAGALVSRLARPRKH